MKKNKNGFTLIEAIGVIIVIALVSIVTVPIIIQSTDKNRENEELCSDAIFASETYLAMKKGDIPNFKKAGDTTNIKLDTLAYEGLLPSKSYDTKEVKVTINTDLSYKMECNFNEKND